MPGANVSVTVTESGGTLTITANPSTLTITRGRRTDPPPVVTIIWVLDASGSSPGAKITNVTFPWPVTGKVGSFQEWPFDQPNQPGKGNWQVVDTNNNGGTDTISYAYNISASVGTVTGTLDPIVDNDPPSG